MRLPDISFGGWFAARAWRSSHRPALTFEGRTWTYGEVLADVDRWAQGLRDRGVRKGDRVAYLGQNHPALLLTLLAASRLGAIFVPLSFRLAPPEIAFILHDSGADVVVADGPRQEAVASLRDELPGVRLIGVEDAAQGWESFEEIVAGGDSLATPAEVDPEDLAIIMYTSGTTGNPKGAMLSHANLWWCHQSLMLLYDVSEDDVTLAVSPLFHIAGLNVTIPTTWQKGGHVVLQRTFEPRAFLDAIEEHRITTLFGVPAMFAAMIELPDFAEGDLSSCRLAICGGAPPPLAILRAMTDRGIRMLNGYGLTETSPVAIFLVPEYSLSKLGSVGWPAMYVESKLVDDDGREITRDQPDVRGEICLRGPNVTRGYWNNPEATKDAFDDAGWFHTGDIGRYDEDGFCYVVDRVKDMVISGGENVYPVEVENVLFDHPAVADVGVIGVPDPRWGEAVTAVIALRPGAQLELADLQAFASERIARFKVPKKLHILPELPRNAAGKLLKTTLREQFSQV